tara:strand:- start:358 stop:561 length:204 start_codon:yes stop_codon:yes gene_type:complete
MARLMLRLGSRSTIEDNLPFQRENTSFMVFPTKISIRKNIWAPMLLENLRFSPMTMQDPAVFIRVET